MKTVLNYAFFLLQINGRISVSKTCHIVAKVARDEIREEISPRSSSIIKIMMLMLDIFSINEKKPW